MDRNSFVLENIGLIKKIVNRYYKIFFKNEYEELLQVAYLQILENADKYDPKKGAVGTFLEYQIKCAILDYINENSSLLYIPSNLMNIAITLNNEQTKRSLENKEPMTEEEMFKVFGDGNGYKKTLTNLKHILMIANNYLNEHTHNYDEFLYLDDGDKVLLKDIISSQENIENDVINKVICENVTNYLKRISNLDAKVFIESYGLEDGICKKEKELAEELNVSRPRINERKRNMKKTLKLREDTMKRMILE